MSIRDELHAVGVGKNHLNGATAMLYARCRALDNDFGRMKRQRIVMQAIFNQDCNSFSSGGSPRRIKDRERFNEGFSEMIARLSPKTIIVYGSANYPCFDLARDKGISVRQYPSATASYYEVKKQE